ncbi:nucleoside triphosphate pyrophosphohydrolase [Actinoplanes nipponensis]|nr:nucleoside triphosphate pyrophosphohydrolase [Actinoplanes nipponensis]
MAESEGSNEMEKLVRDGIPEIIRATGRRPVVRVASDAEYREALRMKLLEETQEYLHAEDLGELADIVEVVFALATDLGYSAGDLEAARLSKYQRNGGFRQRYLWTVDD